MNPPTDNGEPRIDPRLTDALRELGREYGLLGVALAAAEHTDTALLVGRLTGAVSGSKEAQPFPPEDRCQAYAGDVLTRYTALPEELAAREQCPHRRAPEAYWHGNYCRDHAEAVRAMARRLNTGQPPAMLAGPDGSVTAHVEGSAVRSTYSIKTVGEALAVAQTAVANFYPPGEYRDRYARVLDDLSADVARQRPTGPDGKHGDRHTPTCGCDRTDEGGH